MSEVVSLVNAEPGGLRAEHVAGRLGLDKDSAGRYLRRATDAGRIKRTGRGLYTPLSEVSGVSGSGVVVAFPARPDRSGQTGQPDTSDTYVEVDDLPLWDGGDE